MERKVEVSNPITVFFLFILAVAVMSFIVLTNSFPFISGGIKLGHNTDHAFMLVSARAGDEVTIHYDVDTFNGSLEIKFMDGIFAMSAKELWKVELSPGKTTESSVIIIPENGIYLVYVQEHSFGGLYNINWTVHSSR